MKDSLYNISTSEVQVLHCDNLLPLTFSISFLLFFFYSFFIGLQDISVTRCYVSDSSGMWEENEAEEGDDAEDEEDEGLAGQLLSDLIASNKYGTSISPLHQLFLLLVFSSAGLMFIYCSNYTVATFRSLIFHFLVCSRVTDDDYYEDDEEDDPDALKDPIYQIDLQVHEL